MRSININVDKEVWSVEQPVSTINIYKIRHSKGSFEITRNRYSGKWKVLLQTNNDVELPLMPIGKAIEENLGVVN
jgi:hypothetical protein